MNISQRKQEILKLIKKADSEENINSHIEQDDILKRKEFAKKIFYKSLNNVVENLINEE